MTESELGTVHLLESLRPENSGRGEHALRYVDIQPLTKDYDKTQAQRSALVWDAEPDSMEEMDFARDLAKYYLIKTAGKLLITPGLGNRDTWAHRFNEASAEMYGEPERAEVLGLLQAERDALLDDAQNDRIDQDLVRQLLAIYEPQLQDADNLNQVIETSYERERAIAAYGDILRQRFAAIFELVPDSEKEYQPDDLYELFEKARLLMVELDGPEWQEWKVVKSEKSSALSTNQLQLELRIGMKREPANAERARGLLAHELLGHALRAMNGYRHGSKLLGNGLPESLDADEGLCVLNDKAINGNISQRTKDRYTDIALAFGTMGRNQLTRAELHQLALTRSIIREQRKGTYGADRRAQLDKNAWVYVDRLYRGTPGDNRGEVHAVFTKDIAYYAGYKKMADYLVHEMRAGKTVQEIFDYIYAGIFDPTNGKHNEWVKKTIVDK